jgi:hypothetical protein
MEASKVAGGNGSNAVKLSAPEEYQIKMQARREAAHKRAVDFIKQQVYMLSSGSIMVCLLC